MPKRNMEKPVSPPGRVAVYPPATANRATLSPRGPSKARVNLDGDEPTATAPGKGVVGGNCGAPAHDPVLKNHFLGILEFCHRSQFFFEIREVGLDLCADRRY